MAEISKNFISLVALGGLNPQILNVDFLKNNKIVPLNEPPFDKLFQQQKPYTKFISTPVLSNLVLENIEFIVEEGRFQIRDVAISEWAETKIFNIAIQYFKILHYTPLNIIGVNLNATIGFETLQEAQNFQKLFLPENSKIISILSKDNVVADFILRYPYSDDSERIMLSLSQKNKSNKERIANLNYEFNFIDEKNFQTELSKISQIGKYFDLILNQLIKSI
jgi:hypothetical protein